MENMEAKIKHNKKILHPVKNETNAECNCRNKESCPFDGNCRLKSVIYECTVITGATNEDKSYKGATEGEAKTEPIAQASNKPFPTYPVKTGRCPEPPPVTSPTLFEDFLALVITLLLSGAKE